MAAKTFSRKTAEISASRGIKMPTILAIKSPIKPSGKSTVTDGQLLNSTIALEGATKGIMVTGTHQPA
jgi:hypothetical protein